MDQVTTEVMFQGSVPASGTQTYAQKANNSAVKPQKLVKVEFILPFTREIFQNKEEQDKLFKDTVTSIRRGLPAEVRDNITILRTQIEKENGKKLHSVRILAPSQIEKPILELKLKGIDVRNKHLSAWGPKVVCPEAYPREVTLHVRNVPHFGRILR